MYEFHSKIASDLIGKLLAKKPRKRLSSAKEIMKHPFFKNINWDAMIKREVQPPFVPVLQNPTDTSLFEK
jgi:serine/threonine protein kinase